MTRLPSQPLLGLSTIALAIAFNVPFAMLAASYDYPDILRRPAVEALDRFAAGGGGLILTWYAFALFALALVPLAIGLSLQKQRVAAYPALAVGAALVGALSGLAQAIGLMRWVFVIPALAAAHAAPGTDGAARAAAERAFDLLNSYGGVAIGEHLGQLLLSGFIAALSLVQWREATRMTAGVGYASAAAIAFGTGEGLALALGGTGNLFCIATIGGFLGFTLWLILTGVGRLRGPRSL